MEGLLILFSMMLPIVIGILIWMRTPSGKRWFFGEVDDAKM